MKCLVLWETVSSPSVLFKDIGLLQGGYAWAVPPKTIIRKKYIRKTKKEKNIYRMGWRNESLFRHSACTSILALSNCLRLLLSSEQAPIKFVPLSQNIFSWIPLQEINRLRAQIQLSRLHNLSTCTALMQRQVKIQHPYLLTSDLPCLTTKGPKEAYMVRVFQKADQPSSERQ